MTIERLTASGPAVAGLLQEAALLHGPFDGLLLGTTRIRTEAVIHDIRDDTTAQFLEMNVTTFCCCAGLGSFYNASGDVQVEEVRRIASMFPGTLLGWFVHQHGPLREPSIRERAVTAAFAQLVSDGTPVLFATVSSRLDANRATVSFQQRFFEQEPRTIILQPVRLVVENIGSAKQSRDYRPLRAVAALEPVEVSGEAKAQLRDRSGLKGRQGAGGDARSVAARIVDTSSRQTEGMEQLYRDMLREMEASAQQASREQAELGSLKYEVHSMAMSMGL